MSIKVGKAARVRHCALRSTGAGSGDTTLCRMASEVFIYSSGRDDSGHPTRGCGMTGPLPLGLVLGPIPIPEARFKGFSSLPLAISS